MQSRYREADCSPVGPAVCDHGSALVSLPNLVFQKTTMLVGFALLAKIPALLVFYMESRYRLV